MSNSSVISTTNWSQFLDGSSQLPPDIVFNVTEKGKQNEDDIIEMEDWKTAQVSAHKFILAGVSPVFREEFFGPLNTTKEVLDIKETTITAFTTMVNCIYKPNILQNIDCPETLCEVLKLAEKYQIVDLAKSTKLALAKLKITPQNMLFTATTAKNYAKNYAVFEDVSKMLIDKCGDFLKSNMETADQVFDLLHSSHTSFPDGNTELLLELMRANGKCTNCQMTSYQCLDGKDVDQVSMETVRKSGRQVSMVSIKNWIQGDTCSFCNSNSKIVFTDEAGLAVIWLAVSNPGTPGMSFHNGQRRVQKSEQYKELPLICSDHNSRATIDNLIKGKRSFSNIGVEVSNFNLKTPNGDATLVFACKKSSLRTKNMVAPSHLAI